MAMVIETLNLITTAKESMEYLGSGVTEQAAIYIPLFFKQLEATLFITKTATFPSKLQGMCNIAWRTTNNISRCYVQSCNTYS